MKTNENQRLLMKTNENQQIPMIERFAFDGICICVFGYFVSAYFCIFVRDSYLYFIEAWMLSISLEISILSGPMWSTRVALLGTNKPIGSVFSQTLCSL
jgi:hypothetical protein